MDLGIFFRGAANEVSAVRIGSLADVFGIQTGDVVTSVGDRAVTNAIEAIRALRAQTGTSIRVQVTRGLETKVMEIPLPPVAIGDPLPPAPEPTVSVATREPERQIECGALCQEKLDAIQRSLRSLSKQSSDQMQILTRMRWQLLGLAVFLATLFFTSQF